MIPPSLVELAFPAVLAGVLAAVAFNRPSWLRSYTTQIRYYVAMVVYAGFYLTILLVAYILLRPLGNALHWQAWGAAWGAFAVTVGVRTVPALERWIRRWLYKLAEIPVGARRLSAALATRELQVSEEVQARANAMLQAVGIGATFDWLPQAQAQPLHEQMRRAAWLFVQLRDWEAKPPFKRFVSEAGNDLYRLRQRFDAMSFRVSRMLASIELLGQIRHEYSRQAADSGDIDGRSLRRLIEGMIADACEDVRGFYRDACLLATRGILVTRATRGGRKRAFELLGFRRLEPERSDVYLVFAITAGLLFFALWIYSLKVGFNRADLTPFQLRFLIVVVQMGALAIAMLPNKLFGFASGGLHKRTPWAFVAASGACALVFAVLVNILAGAALGGLERVLIRLRNAAPFLPYAIATASSVAWLVQDHRWNRVDSRMLRHGCDAAALGLAWAAAGLLAYILIHVAKLGAPGVQSMSLAIAVTSFVLGATLGVLIPERMRYRPDAEFWPDVLDIPVWVETARSYIRERLPRTPGSS